ncbi:hypothetical protein GOP47_0011422 [Adiantum capillus-veneris]|uniref:SURP motif domain-containing protein n=1 Tax=Adiantum capillus-veneris TaxID=13818 RepID=A0A9D4UT62_ADICA|nr:hypothetical protein GOP47_0011422 [Adiantum capillus-veneris]
MVYQHLYDGVLVGLKRQAANGGSNRLIKVALIFAIHTFVHRSQLCVHIFNTIIFLRSKTGRLRRRKGGGSLWRSPNMEDEDDYVAFGTPLEREEDITSNKRKRQALDQGRLRAGSSSQEVYDENGRRRFHGAFTGGFSAGYYNTVGSKEGWVPQSFTSSRKNRAELAQQRAYDYMDDEERAEQDSTRLVATSDYDTFALTAADLARREAAQELKKRPSVIPGLLLDDVIVPVSRSIGFELLRKMGWRHGRSIGPKHIAASSDAQREGRKAMLALAQSEQHRSVMDEQESDVLLPENDAEPLLTSTPIFVINPKKDRYGFGFDPYKNAPEFRERLHNEEVVDETKAAKRHHTGAFKSSLFRPNVGRMGSGFGIGALEELGEEDEDVYAPGLEIENVLSDEEMDGASFKSDIQPRIAESRPGVLPGFKPASHSGSKTELFPPPVVPPDFVGKHQFRDSLESETVVFSYEPPEVSPPDDPQLRKLIDGLATFVARSGQKLESLYKEKQSSNSLFDFLSEGNGHEYYKWKLWKEQKKNSKEGAQGNRKEATLNSVQRGHMLGEIPLRRPTMVPPEDRARLQSALASSFTSSTAKVESSLISYQPFSADPSKQARFELYLKEKYQGGLRNVHETGKSSLNEWERAQETLEFEAACQNIQKSESNMTATTAAMQIYHKELQEIMNERFTVSSADKVSAGQLQKEAASTYPIREEKQWRPRPLLCKRFNLPDPFSGKPPPLPKPRSKTESFILLSNPTASIANPSIVAENQRPLDSSATTASSAQSIDQNISSSAIKGVDNEDEVSDIVEKPVDLYKAIFSDESDEENLDDQEQKVGNISAEAAHAALNRLEAGDFLASIGKELGLQVPPADFNQMKRAQDTIHQTQAADILAKPPSRSPIRPQMLQSAEQNVVFSDEAVEMQKERHENTEKTGVFLDYPRLELSAEHFDVFSKLSSKPSLSKKVFRESSAANKNQSIKTKIAQESSEDTTSEDSSDSQKKRRSRKRRKKEHKHSKSEKRKSGRDHRRKKRHEEVKHQSHKHQRRKGRENSS